MMQSQASPEREHAEWSTLPVGQLQNGLELEEEAAAPEPASCSPPMASNADDEGSPTKTMRLQAAAANLESFRKNLFGNIHQEDDEEECVEFLPSGVHHDDRSSARLSPSSSSREHMHGGSGPSWTRTSNGSVEQDYFGQQANGSVEQGYFGQQEAENGACNNGTATRSMKRSYPRPPSPNTSSSDSPWRNPLNLSLFVANLLSSVSETIPVILVPTIGAALSGAGNNGDAGDTASSFASRAAASAVLGTSLGKFCNGPVGDIFGSRRVACLYSLLLGVALLGLSVCSGDWVIVSCAIIEFFSSVQQPCVVIILAAHYRDEDRSGANADVNGQDTNIGTSRLWDDVEQHGDSTLREPKAEGRYEAGIYVSSLGSRFGSLLAIPFTAILLHIGFTWRAVARIASLSAFACFLCFYLFVSDAPGKLHLPQNPIRQSTLLAARSRHSAANSSILGRFVARSSLASRLHRWIIIAWSVFIVNVVPSLRSVLSSGTFWIVSFAHAGGGVVRSSERILGQYIHDTSGGTISEEKAGSFTIFLSLGLCFGLAVGGRFFTQTAQQPLKRKKMVVRLYALAVGMCYALSFLAAPTVRALLWSPKIVVLFQIVAAFCMGAGIAVQYYQIPAIVGATFGSQKGVYTSYTDGVAYFVSSLIWRVVGGAVEEGHPEQGGWAYGWAAVALLVVLCSVVMVQFVEHYFCRGGWKGRMERAASDSAMQRKKNDDERLQKRTEDNVVGDRGNFLRRRFGVGSQSPSRSRGVPRSANIGGLGFPVPSSPRRSLNALSQVSMPQISSPLKFIQNLGSLRSKSALGDADEDEEDELDEVAGGNESDEDSTILFDSIAGPVTFDDESIYGTRNSRTNMQLTPEQQRKEKLMHLLALKENQVCVDCPAMYPRWASYVVGLRVEGNLHKPLGCFCCSDCVAFHRQLGTHLVYVRSVDHDTLRERDMVCLELGGNNKVNSLLEATLYQDDTAVKPGAHATNRIRAQYIRQKYDARKWSLNATTGGPQHQESLLFPVDDLLGLHSPGPSEAVQEQANSPDEAIELSYLSVDGGGGEQDDRTAFDSNSSSDSSVMIMSL